MRDLFVGLLIVGLGGMFIGFALGVAIGARL